MEYGQQIKCENCLEMIEEQKMILHQNYCYQNFIRCQKCGRPYDKNEQELHDQEYHLLVKCEHCNNEFSDLSKHICEYQPIICEFCKLSVPKNYISEHQFECGSRTNKCINCQKNILIKNYQAHLLDCPLRQNGASDEQFPSLETINQQQISKKQQKILQKQPIEETFDFSQIKQIIQKVDFKALYNQNSIKSSQIENSQNNSQVNQYSTKQQNQQEQNPQQQQQKTKFTNQEQKNQFNQQKNNQVQWKNKHFGQDYFKQYNQNDPQSQIIKQSNFQQLNNNDSQEHNLQQKLLNDNFNQSHQQKQVPQQQLMDQLNQNQFIQYQNGSQQQQKKKFDQKYFQQYNNFNKQPYQQSKYINKEQQIPEWQIEQQQFSVIHNEQAHQQPKYHQFNQNSNKNQQDKQQNINNDDLIAKKLYEEELINIGVPKDEIEKILKEQVENNCSQDTEQLNVQNNQTTQISQNNFDEFEFINKMSDGEYAMQQKMMEFFEKQNKKNN